MSCSVELRQRRQQGMAEDPHRLAAIMNKSQRLVLGLLVLLLVDIIWVSSSELTKVRYPSFLIRYLSLFFFLYILILPYFILVFISFLIYHIKLHVIFYYPYGNKINGNFTFCFSIFIERQHLRNHFLIHM